MAKEKDKKPELTKEWLFRENVRLQALSEELENQKRILKLERDKLSGEQKVFEQKQKILEMNFRQLAAEREDFKKYVKKHMKAEREEKEQLPFDLSDEESVFFCGINSYATLKKRYKALLKVYHPDNRTGDTESVARINHEFERLKKKLKKT
ncbi:MAG: hypothetical protein K6G07_04635 [Lachnospiraceae bacterium]|nr:hypothetical protein [Lachnospiraceae bacterium]